MSTARAAAVAEREALRRQGLLHRGHLEEVTPPTHVTCASLETLTLVPQASGDRTIVADSAWSTEAGASTLTVAKKP